MSEHARDITALLDLIEARSTRAFAWRKGSCCVSFMGAAVQAQIGIDVLAGLSWRSRRAALAILDELGGLEAAMDARFDRIAPALARRGDVAGLPDPLLGVQLAVVEGATLVAPGETGLIRVQRSAMTMAWDCGSARPTPLESALS